MTWKPDYVTLDDIKDYLRIPLTDDADDVELNIWITAASRAIDDRTNRQFGQESAPVSRTYRRAPYYDAEIGLWALEIDDLMDPTGLTVNGTAYASSGAVLLPDNALLDGAPYTRLGLSSAPVCSTPGVPASNVIVGRWGWSAVPDQVPAAVRLQCNRWNFRRGAPAGVAGSPQTGSELRLLARLDPDVATSLSGLARRRRAA